jgi:hypothetical protein
MSPLTHAAVGMAIFQRVRSPRLGRFGWPLALALAFVSHFLLDAIPHLDAVGPLRGFRYGGLFFPMFGLLGGGLAVYLYRRNRDAGLIWVLLSVWLVIVGLSGTVVRGLAALALLGLLAYRTRRAEMVALFLAGVLAVSPDIVPRTMTVIARFHDVMHFSASWGTSLLLMFRSSPLPSGDLSRLRNPYFLTSLGLEVIVEASIFLVAFWSLSVLSLEKKAASEPVVSACEPEETRAPA